MPVIEREPHRLVVLEPNVDGHPREWLQHLIRYSGTEAANCTVWFVVARQLYEELAAEPALRDGRARILPLEPREQALCTHKSLLVSGLARWWTMRKYLRAAGAEAGHFLSIDHLSLPLALGLRANGCRLSGILFRPSLHYPDLGAYKPSLGERVRDLRKAALYRLLLLNRAVRVVLTLDPYFPDWAAKRFTNGAKVRALPDPVHPPVNATSDEHAVADLVPPGRTMFFLFGHLTERKGVVALLEALRLVPVDASRRIAIVMAGKVEEGLRARLDALCQTLRQERPGLWLHLEDRRISSGELEALITRSDVILAPYQRFVGSSGVLLWAARAGKPVLTQDFGLIGRLVRDYDLGLATDVSDPKALAAGLAQMQQQGTRSFVDAGKAHSFAAWRTPQNFAALVFGSLLRE